MTKKEENKARNETLTTELHFDLFKQYAMLASAMGGAFILMLQLSPDMTLDKDAFVSLALFGGSIFTSLSGKDYIVDSLLKGKDIYSISTRLKFHRYIALIALGMGVGFFVGNLFP